jgi:hypothetical protein
MLTTLTILIALIVSAFAAIVSQKRRALQRIYLDDMALEGLAAAHFSREPKPLVPRQMAARASAPQRARLSRPAVHSRAPLATR